MDLNLLPEGLSATDLARSLGVCLSSVYHWKQPPKYVLAYLRQYRIANGISAEDKLSGE